MTPDPHEHLAGMQDADELRKEVAQEIKSIAKEQALTRPMPTRPEDYSYRMLKYLAADMCESNIFGIKDERAAFALMLLCKIDGIDPINAVRDYHFIEGKPAMKAEAMLRRFQMAGGKVQYHKHCDEVVEATFTAPDGTTLTHSWSIDTAKAAGVYGKGVWQKYPAAMLRNRVLSESIRSIWPAVLGGMYESTEVAGFAGAGGSPVNVPDVAEESVIIEHSPAPPEDPPAAAEVNVDDLNDLIDNAQTREDFNSVNEVLISLSNRKLRGELIARLNERAAALDEAESSAPTPSPEPEASPALAPEVEDAFAQADADDSEILSQAIDDAKTTAELDAIYRDLKGVADEGLAVMLEERWKQRMEELSAAEKAAEKKKAEPKKAEPKKATPAKGKKLTAAEQKTVDAWVQTLTALAHVHAQVPDPFDTKVSELNSVDIPDHIYNAVLDGYEAKAGEGAPRIDGGTG